MMKFCGIQSGRAWDLKYKSERGCSNPNPSKKPQKPSKNGGGGRVEMNSPRRQAGGDLFALSVLRELARCLHGPAWLWAPIPPPAQAEPIGHPQPARPA